MFSLQKLLFFFLLFFFSIKSYSQYFVYGQDPASIKWMEINTDNFQLLYPDSYSNKAFNVATILEKAYEKASVTLNHRPDKITVIFHNETVVSNGFVAPAPTRMELFSVPPQNNRVTPWMEHLCIHEMRHIVQVDKLNQGITKIFTYLFGEQATGAAAGLVPMWFYEGDAVIAESALGPGGRGRFPEFSKGIRTNLLDSNRRFGFNKMLLGSYKNYTPDHYSLGYHLAAYGRLKHDTGIWSDVMNYTARNPYFAVPFRLGLKKYSGLSTNDLYQSSMQFYDSLWTQQANTVKENGKEVSTFSDTLDYENYRFPHYAGKDSIIALRSDFSHLRKFVLITPEEQKDIHTPGILTSNDFSYSKDKIVWSERQFDLRWTHRNWSVIKIFDLETDVERVLTEKTRMFSPSISPGGKRIVTVRITKDNQYSLVVLGTKNGWQEKEFASPNNMFLQRPVWSPDEKRIFVLALTENGKAIYSIDYNSGKWKEVLDPGFENIANLSVGKEYIFFHSTLDGMDNIFALNRNTDQLYQLTESKYGARDVSFSKINENILYSDYDPKGYEIKKLNIEKADLKLFDKDNKFKDPVIAEMEKQEPGFIDFTRKKDSSDYHPQRYRRWKHLFNFHSWAPFYYDESKLYQGIIDVAPGATLLSQNDLSTAISTLGYAYKKGSHRLYTGFSYQGWYPVIGIYSNIGGKPGLIKSNSAGWAPKLRNDYMEFTLDISLPLDLEVNKNITRFIPSVSYNYTRDFYYNYLEDYYLRGIKTIDYNVQFQTFRRKAYRDIFPKWGLTTGLSIKTSPFSESILGNMFALQGKVYLPGFIEDHGISFTGGYQNQNPELYIFSSRLSFPRGYENLYSEKLYVFRSDYVLPLYYPDWSVGSLIYFKRFKADLFYDYAMNQYRYQNKNTGTIEWATDHYSSYGVEFTTDFFLMRIMFPLSAGVRYAYKPTFSEHSFEFVFDIDLFSIYNHKYKK